MLKYAFTNNNVTFLLHKDGFEFLHNISVYFVYFMSQWLVYLHVRTFRWEYRCKNAKWTELILTTEIWGLLSLCLYCLKFKNAYSLIIKITFTWTSFEELSTGARLLDWFMFDMVNV